MEQKIDKLLNSISALSKKLIIEEGSFFPLIHYYLNNEIISTTVFNDKTENDYLFIINNFIVEKQLFDYSISLNDIENKAIKIEICIDNKKYDFVYIGYHKLNEGFLFSKLLNFNELKEWHKIKN
jgi:hypothetical protein